MPIEDIEFYSEAKYRGVLPPELVRQLAALAGRVLEVDGRESSYVDENDCFRTAKIARLDNVAIAEASGKVEGYLIELNDTAAFKLKARRRLFSFEADDFGAPRLKESAGPPDLWYNAAVSELTQRLDSHG